ncbi:3-methyl-2-oxobutanoate hydroxymethyltransferase [Evansella sp. AB-P1]|uniref:3-methyl-2-oxobutanoate hydroxymethyltransferase n=1 Tax=Evansella sp. AB-P1 TaxID=3037653 RepID=UPI00241E548A|nr:3-methyl-2-oxobutanoate hydroxymethyltransferase [Evansella sp. AB-P1]MDG5787566.1 3-methyl-2-oxobutanoate hydroxymethyltransferase [Evansella sp. AB-P1]
MKTTNDLRKMKEAGDKISMLTAYDAPSAKLAEEAGIDTILVGDSLGMVVLGYESTIYVTIDDMIHHTKAVKRGVQDTFVVTDMPYLTYHSSFPETLHHAKRLMQEGGANAVKLEGGGTVIDTTKQLVEAGVPVISHLGLTPQSVAVLGGYRVQGKTNEEAERMIEDAKKVEAAGACMLVLECVPEALADEISCTISIPVIGIGAGRYTDGQVLVYHDLIGYTQGHIPKFVKRYYDASPSIFEAIKQYHQDVKNGLFPEEKHVFQAINKEEQQLYGGK